MATSDADRKKVLVRLKRELLAAQKKFGRFYDEMNCEINGLLFEIDKVLPKKKS